MKIDRKVDKKIKNLIKNFGFKKDELHEIRKMYKGEVFDKNDKAYIRLLDCSKEICNKYTELIQEEMLLKSKNKRLKLNVFAFIKYYFAKLSILKRIFPIHGFILYAEDGLEAVIGLVDLKGYGFINKNVKFTPNSLVEVKKSNVFAFNITIGDVNRDDNQSKLSKIIIEKNCWLGAGVKVFGNVNIGRDSVIGAGAEVNSNIPDYSLAVGRPAKIIRKIDKQDRIIRKNYSESNTNIEKIDIVKRINGGNCPKAFINMVNGKPFNSIDKKLGYLISLTRQLCFEFNLKSTKKERKEEILNILFIKSGDNVKVGSGLYVDMLGTIKLGNNVEIGDNVFLGGNLNIRDNVNISNGAILFASGHGLCAEDRLMKFTLQEGFYELTQYNTIEIVDNVSIGKNAVITPKSVVNIDVPAECVFAKNKIIHSICNQPDVIND